MLISHKYRFIFIKTRKTAGTSLEVDLSRVMGESDVVTEIKPPEEGHLARNFAIGRFYNHMPAREVRSVIGRRIFGSYFKFCIEREPVDKCVSWYSMRKNSPAHSRGNDALTWDGLLRSRDFPLDEGLYTSRWGGLLVDRVLHYERLSDELPALCKELVIPLEFKSRAKSGFRTEVPVTWDDRQLIYRAFRKSLKFTGYSLIPDEDEMESASYEGETP
ncbi:MAG TPA: sulfotransferase family 2 domain-containing protein [Steroidobacteraceae bacterium]|nr:sulfotransferase family 2 domain-containing protein [Steroidobacteraceae bacterium]